MDLINLALKYRDYEWLNELLKLDKQPLEQNEPQKEIIQENARADLFKEESVALEMITNTYAVKEKMGVRAFNINSEFDRNLSEIVMVEKPSYRKGEKVKFRNPSNEEMIFARGIVNGYIMGYGEANNNINMQLMEYFNSVGAQPSKKQNSAETNPKKLSKPKKGRISKE